MVYRICSAGLDLRLDKSLDLGSVVWVGLNPLLEVLLLVVFIKLYITKFSGFPSSVNKINQDR